MNSPKLYLLSEMNLSDRHGGGLTLQRILDEDLNNFDHFIQLLDYPSFPTNPKYLPRVVELWKDLPAFIRPEFSSRFSKEYLLFFGKRTLGIPMPEYQRHDFINFHLYKNLLRKVSIERDKFLVVPQRFQSVYLTNNLYKNNKIHYAAWVMDDHLLKYNKMNGFYYAKPPGFERHYKVFLKNAQHVFVISESMGEFYKERFGINSTVLFGSSDPIAKEQTENQPDDHIRLCYFGAVWKWQQDALEILVKTLDKLNASLYVYTFHKLTEDIKSHPRVFIEQTVAAQNVKNIMAKYDGVIVPYGFIDDVRPLSALNISTKLSECLASGIPTVLVGPEYGAMTKFARKHNCAVILSDMNNPAQIEAFRNAFGKGRNDLLANARNVAERVTSTTAMRNVWKEGWAKVVAESEAKVI